jgi:hypothetical protein
MPEAPEITESHGALLAAVQEQPAGAVTTILELPPFESNAIAGVTEKLQLNASWSILKVLPPTEIVALRAAPALEATE